MKLNRYSKFIFVLGSISDFESMLALLIDVACKDSLDEKKNWPSTWAEVNRLLIQLGYTEPVTHYVCLSKDHPCSYWVSSLGDTCLFCGFKCPLKFYYMPLADKIKKWLRDEEFCKKIMSPWLCKETWFKKCTPGYPLKELWDGQRWRDLSWFWDPENEFVLPQRCNFCQRTIPGKKIESADNDNNGDKSVRCESCGIIQNLKIEKAFGDPRNLAFILHWDGWSPGFSKPGSRSCGRFEFTFYCI